LFCVYFAVLINYLLAIQELQEIQRRVREEKKAARRAVKEFEEQFRTQTGRRALKEDREPLEKTYRYIFSLRKYSGHRQGCRALKEDFT
jgi:hypothetical protein